MFSGLNLAFFSLSRLQLEGGGGEWQPRREDDERRVITGADLLGRLLRGISRRVGWQFAAASRTPATTEPSDSD